MWRLMFPALCLLVLGGCAGVKEHNFGNDGLSLDYDATRRGQLFTREPVLLNGELVGYRFRSLSESPPDVTFQTALEATLKGSYAGVSAEARLNFAETAVKLASRSERVELMRDALFRLSEGAFNSGMSAGEYKQAHEGIVKQVLAATLSDSIADVQQTEIQTRREIAILTSKQADLKVEEGVLLDQKKGAGTLSKDQATQLASIQAEIGQLETQIKSLGETARSLKETLVNLADGLANLLGGQKKGAEGSSSTDG